MATAAERAESREMEEKLSYPWEKHFSEEHGMFYYFNVLNGESSWQKPTEAEVDSSVEETQQQPVHGANYHEYRLEEDYFVEIREGLEGGDDTSDNWAQTEPESPQYYGAVNSEDQEHETDSVVSETLSYSTNKTSSTSMGVYERSAQMMMAKKEREEAMRLKLEQQKLQGIQSVPTINKKSKSLSRNVDDMLAWEQKRKQKLAMKQMELEALELESLTGKPMVTKTAERLARQWQEQDDGISDTTSVVSGVTGISAYTNRTHSVQDRLLYYDEQRKAKLQRLKEEQAVAIRAAANPKVAPHSANLQRPGDVADRLYNLAHQKQEENVYVSNVQHDEHGNRLFQPKLNKNSEQLARRARPQVPVEEFLQYQGELAKQKILRKEREMEKRAAAIRDMPKINSVSERIMMEKYLLEGETAEDRLTRPIGQIRQRTLDDIEKPTFKPTIKKISSDDYNLSYRGSTIAPDGTRYRGYNQELDDDDEDEDNYLSGNVQKALDDMHLQNFNNNYFDDYSNGTPMPREYNPRSDSLIPQRVNASKTSEKQTMKSAKSNMYDRTVKWEEERQRRLERERMQREKEQEQQYSFKPKLENYARVMNSMYGNSATMSYDSGGMSIAERNELWVKEREKKLEKERQKKAEEAVKDCSFTPNITPLPDYLMDEKAKVERAVTKSLEDLATNAFHFKKFHEVSSPAQEDAYDDDDDENEKEEVDCGILPISKRIPLPPRGTSYAQPTHVGIESNFDNRINTERLVAINPRNYNTTLPNPLPPPAPSVEQSQKIPIPYKSYKIGGSGVTELSASNQQSARVDGSVQGKQFSIAPRVLAPSATNTSSYYKSNSLESILDGNQAQCAPVVDDDYYDSVELAPEFDLQSLANKKLSISPCRTAGLVDSYRSADNGKGIGTTKTTSAVSEVGNIDAIRQRFSSLEEPYY